MPPRTRTRPAKDFKENVDAVKKTNVKSIGKITKPTRKALADKTNSLSDDNASIDVPIKISKNKAVKIVSKDDVRPRRDRRLPTRYVENNVLNNLSNNQNIPLEKQASVNSSSNPTSSSEPPSKGEIVKLTPPNNKEVKISLRPKRNCRLQSVKEPLATKKPETPSQSHSSTSPFKTPSQSIDSSLIVNRPRRICRLPSKFEDHSTSPHKFLPVQPCHASTPLIKKKAQNNTSNANNTKIDLKTSIRKGKVSVNKNEKTKGIEHYFTKTQTDKKRKDQTSPDTNNNPKGKRILPKRVVNSKSPTKQISPKATVKFGFGQRLLEKSLSFRVFEDRKPSDKDQDIYEFTYDPNEEPPPQKKKRKRVAKKKPPKPKTVVLINNYEKNVEKALESLKSKVKPSQPKITQLKSQTQSIQPKNDPKADKNPAAKIQIIEDIIIKPAIEIKSVNNASVVPVNDSAKSIHMSNYVSINVDDIAADFEAIDSNHTIDYSPVNSPRRSKTPEVESHVPNGSHVPVNDKDPLNLQGDTSFFDEQPVASSSMNVSVRHPLASPWRVEFGNLPIRWQANTYVKPNMTPAVESSFINSEEISKKNHVYTNLIAEEPLPRLEDPPNLKQPSIISFMREVAERSLKKKRGRSISPTKANSLFEDNNTEYGYKTPKKARKEKTLATPNASNSSNDKSCEKENSNHNENQENTNHSAVSNECQNSHHEENSNKMENSPNKKQKNNKDATFFGFDESENNDQENVSPIKNIRRTRARALRSKSRAVLRENNAFTGPIRATLPVAVMKLASSDVVEKLYDQLKSAEDAPQFPEKGRNDETAATNDEHSSSDDDGQSVHLFEDIDVIHHLKPQRKSYGKAKKVTFRQQSNSDSDTQTQVPEVRSSDEDDRGDLTFQEPNAKQKKVIKKKKKPKKLLSKKEEKEVDEWAAGFNSMCEDIEEFPLVVE